MDIPQFAYSFPFTKISWMPPVWGDYLKKKKKDCHKYLPVDFV